jgi:hypothetical protein
MKKGMNHAFCFLIRHGALTKYSSHTRVREQLSVFPDFASACCLLTMTAMQEREKAKEESHATLLLKRLLDVELAESAVNEISNMRLYEERNSEARKEFASAKACSYIVKAMRQYSESVSMQRKCCQLLIDLSFSNDINKTDAFFSEDAAKAIADSMARFPHDREIQLMGTGALRALLCEQKPPMFVQAGGLRVIMPAMKEYPDDHQSKPLFVVVDPCLTPSLTRRTRTLNSIS